MQFYALGQTTLSCKKKKPTDGSPPPPPSVPSSSALRQFSLQHLPACPRSYTVPRGRATQTYPTPPREGRSPQLSRCLRVTHGVLAGEPRRVPSRMAATPRVSTGRREVPAGRPPRSRRAARRDRRERRGAERAGPGSTCIGRPGRCWGSQPVWSPWGSAAHPDTARPGHTARRRGRSCRLPARRGARPRRSGSSLRQSPAACCAGLFSRGGAGCQLVRKLRRKTETQVIAEISQRRMLPPSCVISACARGVTSAAAAAILVTGAIRVRPAGPGGGTAALWARHAQRVFYLRAPNSVVARETGSLL